MQNEKLTQSITPQLIEYTKAQAMKACADNEKCTMFVGIDKVSPIINR